MTRLFSLIILIVMILNSSSPTTQLPYRDTRLPVDQRVADLLSRMTLEEKIAQTESMWVRRVVEPGTFSIMVGPGSRSEQLLTVKLEILQK